MNKKRYRLTGMVGVLALAAVTLGLPTIAQAAVSEKDFQVIARALSFVQNGPKGTVDIAIVHNPDNPASLAEADAANQLLGSGFKAGALTLRPIMVSTADLGKAAGAGAMFVTSGTDAHHDAILGASKTNGIVSITTDRGCVTSAKCAMFVASSPKVQILVNSATASALNISFDSAFRMMITEL